MTTIQRFHTGARLSEATVHQGTAYLAGQVADDATQDIAGQTAMGAGELLGAKMKSASDRTVFLGLAARAMSAAIAGGPARGPRVIRGLRPYLQRPVADAAVRSS